METKFNFRAWDHDNKKMIFWTLNDLLVRFGDPGYEYNVKDRPSPLFDWMQCTCLKDKNGYLIYEGDIIRYFNDIYTITYRKGRGLVAKGEEYIIHLGFLAFHSDKMTILGNKFGIPELLENHFGDDNKIDEMDKSTKR